MTLPVSSYEELLARVRSLTSETIQLRREITSSLCEHPELGVPTANVNENGDPVMDYSTQSRAGDTDKQMAFASTSELDSLNEEVGKSLTPSCLFSKKEDEIDVELKEIDEKRTSPDMLLSKNNTFHRNDWGPESLGLWHSGPSSLFLGQPSNTSTARQDSSSVISFSTSMGSETQPLNSFSSSSRRTYSHQQLGAKVEMVYNLLSLLGPNNRQDMSKTFLAMSSSPESCNAMRQSGCLPLLIQLIHSPELEVEVRNRAAEALHNIVHAQTDDKRRRREIRVLKLLQQVREYSDELKITQESKVQEFNSEKHPVTAVGALMKFSFDAEHRQAICTLGGLQAITELIQVDHEAHGSSNEDTLCITLRRYAGMSLTNLTFGDGKNKALLCSFSKFMRALVDQLKSPSEDLRQVTASVLRNLSWRADSKSKQALRDVGAVTALTITVMEGKKESTLKSILSALWNLSAHCSMNKVDICSVPGALAFLVKMLRYKSTSNTLAIIENAGGIIRNISSHIAVREDYRQVLRDNNCFEILLEQLKSPSLTIVSNACGTLWNLSARCPEDQRRLWEMGATSMLRSLVQSKHKMISMGSSAALKNLLTANPNGNLLPHLDSTARSLGLQNLPTLFVRKQRALEQELDITLSETCDNIEPGGSPTHLEKTQSVVEEKKCSSPKRSDSHESIRSTQSDSVYERLNEIATKNENKIIENKTITLHDSLNENQSSRKAEDQKLVKRYRGSMIPTPAFKKINQEKINEKTRQGKFVEEKIGETHNKADPKANQGNGNGGTNGGTKEKIECKRGIPVLKSRSKMKVPTGQNISYGQCYSGSSFTTQYEEEYPVNYSLKYSETESYKMNNKTDRSEKKFKENKKFEEYSDYAETDLDQPTDFSLKYGEKTSSDEDIKNPTFNYYDSDKTKETVFYSSQTEDTTRTYYTEGTPYEGTPYNFSSSNSMTDLRADPDDDVDDIKPSFSNKKAVLNTKFPEEDKKNPPVESERKECGMHYNNLGKDCQNRLKKLSRQFESGVCTPERPVQYCEEGTPGDCFSRVSSLSSLNGSKELSCKNSPEKISRKNENKQTTKKLNKNLDDDENSQHKVVKFGVAEHHPCEDQTPLMFSRCSSMNSLSSFEHITQSIPDDRSSVVSDFSRMTSGIISPSELPDSPTQTVPPSPKLNKPPVSFPSKEDCAQKKSFFEDDVATYKLEDTPVEFSRATSLSSLNIENSVRSDSVLKTNSTASSLVSTDDIKPKDGHNNSFDKNHSDDLREQIVPQKTEMDKDKFELKSVTEVDENILADCINIGIQGNSRNLHKNVNNYLNTPQEKNKLIRQSSAFPVKSNCRQKFSNDSGKVYSTYEESDDVVHTYYTEGTPASVSHAGSHSDLSTLSVVSGIPPSGFEDNSDDGSFCSGDTESILAECIQSGMPKAKPHKDKVRVSTLDDPVDMTMNKILCAPVKGMPPISNGDVYLNNLPRFEYLRRKDHQLTAKDETSTFATENSPCDFSVRSSLSDLTINSADSPACVNRPETSGKHSSHKIPSLLKVSQTSPNPIGMIVLEDGGKPLEQKESDYTSAEPIVEKTKYWSIKKAVSDVRNDPEVSVRSELTTARSRTESPSSLSVESFDSSEPTPLEQALLEQCINSGMPHKSNSKKSDGNNFNGMDSYKSSKVISVNSHSNRLGIALNVKDEETLSKNENISSAIVVIDTMADEESRKRIVEGLENTEDMAEQKHSNKKESDGFGSNVQSNNDLNELINPTNSNQGDSRTKNFNENVCPEKCLQINCSSLINKGENNIGKFQSTKIERDNFKRSNDILPNFKIGSEITDSKFLQDEANKICREIRRYQEMDMGCSLTSEASLVSCSSFLDTTDYSLFDFANEVIDFEDSENKGKTIGKVRNLPFKKSLVSLPTESVSLPSVSSLRNEQIEALDLESSIISVASITSEVAETYSKDKDYFNTYAKTCGNDNSFETLEENVGKNSLDKDDETLNADELGNNTEIFDDDNSLCSQENLPLDSECQKEVLSSELKRKLTPKEKRKAVQERYRTYTIRDLKANVTDKEPENKSEEMKINPTVTNCRNTYLIDSLAEPKEVFKNNHSAVLNNNESCKRGTDNDIEEKTESIKSFSNFLDIENKHELLNGSFGLDQSRGYAEKSAALDADFFDDLLVVGPAERKELVHNAKLVAFSLKTAIQEVDGEVGLISDSEGEGSRTMREIDTRTYINTPEHYNINSNETFHNSDEDVTYDMVEDPERKGPKILKPDEKDREEKIEELSKAIRGKRKQLYSSPLKKPRGGISSTPSSPKISQTPADSKKYNLTTTKSLPNVPRSIPKSSTPPVLQREGTFTKEESSTQKKNPVKNARAIPVYTRNTDVKGSLLTKPAVRNKSAPVLRNSKNVSDVTKPARPVSSYVSKTNEKQIEMDSSHKKYIPIGSATRISGNTKKCGASTQVFQNLSSNQNLKSNNGTRNISGIKPKSSLPPSAKSQSNSASDAISSNASNEKGKPKTPKKEVTSKIASLWKKVEETKRKNKNLKDSRIWIGSEKDVKAWEEVLVLEQEEILDIPTGKIVKSSTFQGLANVTPKPNSNLSTDVRNEIPRNSGDFGPEQNSFNVEGRNIISAVVPPYNYNPPVSTGLTPSTFKHVDNFQSGPMKVTTV